jgi:hypothetical protein
MQLFPPTFIITIIHRLVRRLDSIGIGGFSHDFGSLDGKHSSVAAIFDTFSQTKQSFISQLIFLIAIVFPMLAGVPTSRNLLIRKLHSTMGEIADELLERTRAEKQAKVEENQGDKSVIGLLSEFAIIVFKVHVDFILVFIVKAENANSGLHLSQEEVQAQVGCNLRLFFHHTNALWSQMNVLLLAGYETTSSE